ncbi:NUDIX hydrolase [candidate division KSB1 bacterium]
MNKDYLDQPVLSCNKIYTGKYLDLEKIEVGLPDGRKAEREVVRVRDAVAVLPVDEEGNVYLVRQHRPAIGRTIIEIPAGLIDDGEDAESSAVRECEEETGYKPGELRELVTYAHAEGYSTGMITLYLGTKLEKTGKMNFDESEILELVKMPFRELMDKVKSKQFIDSKTIISTLICEKILDY